jgi:alanyl-tRNA synthetase
MKTDELREKYLAFFESKGHTRCDSDVLVPTWDPSVLFTPAGMNQFKDHFLGKVKLDFTRATTCQKCLRTGDIDNVGRTAYHHTFFEMLGNFSFGDYFKRDAINWAWEFLTDKSWLGIDPARLTVSVYKDDEEAAQIWAGDIGISSDRIERLDEDENFWPASAPSQGPDGVCGPCSEIFYHDDFGGNVEIWNLVFTQFNRVGDPPDNLRPLPSKNIDTGMGLERAAATLQGVETNYHIDILRPIVEAAAEVCHRDYQYNSEDGRRLRRITDHIRACTMAVHENVYPGAQKEKYVIRRLLRRAVLDGHQMGRREPFLCEIVPAVVDAMTAAYPDLAESTQRVANVIRSEESNFFGTLDAGLARIEKIFNDMASEGRATIDGSEAADLYQTYGVPAEVFEAMAAEHNLAFDWEGFRRAMEQHGEASGKATHTVMGSHGPIDAIKKVLHYVEFVGYEMTEAAAELKFIISQDQLCDHLQEVGHENAVQIVLDRTPFYGESGGQVGDTGEITGDGFRFEVTDTQKDGHLVLHSGHLVEGELRAGEAPIARVDEDRRHAIRRAHSATHILHYALQKNLGSHAQQQGSKVDGDWLRFDFTNPNAVAADQLQAVQIDVETQVAAAAPVAAQILPLAEARQAGAMMLFGEKYPDPVRMVSMGEFSKELCGGTHLDNTSQVDAFEIIAEESVSAGTRRIVALTGERARQHVAQVGAALAEAAKLLDVPASQVPSATKSLASRIRDLRKQISGGGAAVAPSEAACEGEAELADKVLLQQTASVLKVAAFDVPQRIESLLGEVKQLDDQVAKLESSAAISLDGLLESGEQIDTATIVVADIPGANSNRMRNLIDQLRQKNENVAALLASTDGDKVTLVAGVSQQLEKAGMHAGNWVREVAKVVGGGGGGKPSMAQAGGKLPEKLPEALDTARQFARSVLNEGA